MNRPSKNPLPLPRLPSPEARAITASPPPPTLMEAPVARQVLALRRPTPTGDRPFDAVLKGLDLALIRRR